MQTRSLVPFRSHGRWPWSRNDPFSALQQAVDSVFEDFSSESGFLGETDGGSGGTHLPHIDFTEEEDRYVVCAELPGMEKKDVTVSTTRDTLTIRGEKREEKEKRGRRYHRHERRFGQFLRVVSLPEDADTEKVSAEFKNGVLTVGIPKSEQARSQTKQIEVRG